MSPDRRMATRILFAFLVLITLLASRARAATTYSIGGKVSGLATGASVTLVDNATDKLVVHANGAFKFTKMLASKAKYTVTVGVEPTGGFCSVTGGTGTVGTANIASIVVTCGHSIGGTVSGLKSGASVTLLDNGGNALKVTANGKFTFPKPLAAKAAFNVTVSLQPKPETCVVVGGKGTVGTVNITSIKVECGFTIGGTVAGLTAGQSLTLLDKTTESVKVSANGAFKFPTPLPTGTAYLITVAAPQPKGEICTVTAGAKGTVASANIANIAVVCAVPTYSINVAVSGLTAGQSVKLLDNGTDSLTASTNGSFSFPKKLPAGAAYNVTIGVQPTAETCTVSGGKGNVGNANPVGISVTCTPKPTYSISGSVSGLTSTANSITLKNGSATVTATFASPSFTFTGIVSGSAYAVTVVTPPAGENCTVSANGSGASITANVTGVTVTCTAATSFTIGGNITGLHSGQSVILLDNGGDALTINGTGSNQSFTFTTPLASAATYLVTVGTQPAGEFCDVASGSGTVASANITNVAVNCTPLAFSIGGHITGLASGQSVTLLDNGGDALTIDGTGSSQSFTFNTSIDSGSNYAVTVDTQPDAENCTVTAGSGKVASSNVTNVAVACSPIATFSIGGNVSGLTSGTLTLLDNGGDAKNITANGAFTFATKVGTGRAYDVTVGTDPAGQTCKVTSGSGTVASANINNVAVACSKSGGSGGGTSYWIPYSAAPQANLPQGQSGTTGLFLIPSDKIATAPAPEFVTSAAPNLLGIAFDVSSSSPITLTPGIMMYSAVGKDGNTHVYGLVLDDTSTFPTPVQISNLSLDSTQTVCDSTQAQTSLADPTTLFALIQVGDAATNCSTTSAFKVVHYKDSSSTAPVAVNVNTTNFDTLYTSGTLSGLVMLDDVSSNLYLYADDTFTNPTTLLTKVDVEIGTGTSKINFNDPLHSNTNLFLDITTATGAPKPSGLYYIASTATSVSLIHAGSIGSTVADDTNFYFTDTTSTTQTLIYQVAITGGTAKLLYTGASTATTNYNLIGTNDSLLAFYTAVSGGLPFSATNKFFTIPIGSSSASATQIGATAGYTALATAFLASPNGSGPSGNKIFISLETGAISMSGITIGHASFVLPFSGSSNPTPTANSVYNPLGLDTLLLGNGVWQVTGITDTNGGWGGTGNVASQTNVSTLANTPFTSTAGGNYAIPSGYIGDLFALGTNNTGIGLLGSTASASDPELGLAADLDANVIYQISIVNTNVAPF